MELKPCPFCGEGDEIAIFHYIVGMGVDAVRHHGLYCNGCDKHITSEEGWTSKEQATEAWNKRA